MAALQSRLHRLNTHGILYQSQKRDGITSDGIVDDGSSSMSDRQEKRHSQLNRKKLSNIFRRVGSSAAPEDGYESDADASTGSTRSTSSSFLRYQNRAIWKAKLIKKTILQRRGDGVEVPVENETKPWPIFDRIYKRQNQLYKKGDLDEGEEFDDDDDDSEEEDGLDECPLAPPAPIYTVGLDHQEEECFGEEVEYKQSIEIEDDKKKIEQGVFGRFRKFVYKKSPGVADDVETPTLKVASDTVSPTAVWESVGGQPEETTQQSGIPTSEQPKAPQLKDNFPAQSLTDTSITDTTSESSKPEQSPEKPSSHSTRQKKKKTSFQEEERKDIEPRSIPRTISYSLRSAIGDGSARQRNSHSLMERRPLRPNGCSVNVSYWSHRGKRNYMEDRFVIEHMGSTSKNKEDSKPISLMAVFDGHGGSACSQFCSDWISSYIRKKNDHYPDNLPMAMKTAFTKVCIQPIDFITNMLLYFSILQY